MPTVQKNDTPPLHGPNDEIMWKFPYKKTWFRLGGV